jgi:hypothetical protein
MRMRFGSCLKGLLSPVCPCPEPIYQAKKRVASNVPIVAMNWRDNGRTFNVTDCEWELRTSEKDLGSWFGRGAPESGRPCTVAMWRQITVLRWTVLRWRHVTVCCPRKNETLDVITSKVQGNKLRYEEKTWQTTHQYSHTICYDFSVLMKDVGKGTVKWKCVLETFFELTWRNSLRILWLCSVLEFDFSF